MKKASLIIIMFLLILSFCACNKTVNQENGYVEKNQSSSATQMINQEVAPRENDTIIDCEPVVYKFTSMDEFKEKIKNNSVKTYMPIEEITTPTNVNLLNELFEVDLFYYETSVVYLFGKNEYNINEISVDMYAPKEYSNEKVSDYYFGKEFEEQSEDGVAYAKVVEYNNTKYFVSKAYFKKENQTKIIVSTIINERYLLTITFGFVDGDVDFDASILKELMMENINI
jgi:hypothetical protein